MNDKYMNEEASKKNKQKIIEKLAYYGDKEELWQKIAIITLALSFSIFIFIAIADIEYEIFINTTIVLTVIASTIIFIYLVYRTFYNNCQNKLMVINNPNGIKVVKEIITPTENLSKPPASGINYVLSGRYKNVTIRNTGDMLIIGGMPIKNHISSYTIIDETNIDKYSFAKGALGIALFGGVGFIAGLKGKRKKEYIIDIEWTDGKDREDGGKSIILIDNTYFKVFVQCLY